MARYQGTHGYTSTDSTNIDRLLPPCGLVRMGWTCYSNVLIQALLSCPSFIRWISNCHSKLGAIIMDIYRRMQRSPPGSIIRTDQFIANMSQIMSSQSQECAYECLQIILDNLEHPEDSPVARMLFMPRYANVQHCNNCPSSAPPGMENMGEFDETGRTWDNQSEEPNQDFIDVPPEAVTEEQIRNYIVENYHWPDDFTCEVCGTKSCLREGYKPIMRTTKLKRVGQIIVLLFKKYYGKFLQDFPHQFAINGRGGVPMIYNIVAQIDHFGNHTGGHYNCRVLRQHTNSPARIAELRAKISAVQDALQRGRILLADARAQRLQYEREIAEAEANRNTNGTAVYLISDERYQPSTFEATENTVMVFYHRIKI